MNDLVAIGTRNAAPRVIIVAIMLAVFVFSWVAVRWQVGNMLATLTQDTDPNLAAIAELATNWAPADPAAFSLKAAAGGSTSATVEALEEAVRRAPKDYRWRTALGRAYEQDEQFAEAEQQLQKAVVLAPSYSSARWHLGNFYLRQEKAEKALAELQIAAENSFVYRSQVFSLVWEFSGRDAEQLEKLAGERADMRARLAYFFAARGRAEESLRNWNRLNVEEKHRNAAIARSIALGLFDQKHFPQALEFARQYGSETVAAPETITNGSFESLVGGNEESRFGWLIVRNDATFEAVPDSRVRREGNRSLRLTFKGFNKPSLANVSQTVVVEPGRRYNLRFWVRTDNLRSSGLPLVEVVNANDGHSIARSQAIAPGTNDWNEISISFTAPDNSSGITLRTVREFCGEGCSINGIVWYDEFNLSWL